MLKENLCYREIFPKFIQMKSETTYKSVYNEKIEDECIQLEYDFTVKKQIN